MKSFLVFIASFSLIFSINAAEKSAGAEDMPQGFKSGDAEKGSALVGVCASCHGVDGNSISSDWPKLADKTKDIFMNNFNILKMAKEIMH
jgi:cytochrome c553